MTPPASVAARFARRMKAERKAAGMTATALAKAAGVNCGTILRIESGEGGPHLDTAVAVARVLGIGLDWLLDGGETG